MKKKRFYLYITGCALAMAVVTSCSKKFLEEELYSDYAPSTLTDSLGFEASVVGLHNHLLFLQ
jgi:hypothetical protein